MSALDSYSVGRDWSAHQKFLRRRFSGTRTGWDLVDRTLLGLGSLVVLQGEPGSNKSTAALQIASWNAQAKGSPALILDQENGFERTRERLACQVGAVSGTTLRLWDSDGDPRLAQLQAQVGALPLWIVSGEPLSAGRVEELADALVEEAGDRQATLVVDSVQSLPWIVDDERANLEAWLRKLDGLKLKHEGKLTILATSEKGYAHFGEASLRGAKGSSSVPYKGETIFDFRSLGSNAVRIEVVKHRDGIKGVAWDFDYKLEDPANPVSFTFGLEPRARVVKEKGLPR